MYFCWAVYLFSNWYFSSTIQSQHLPFRISLVCYTSNAGGLLFAEFCRTPRFSVVAMTSYTTSGRQEKLLLFTAISSILIASSPAKLQQHSGNYNWLLLHSYAWSDHYLSLLPLSFQIKNGQSVKTFLHRLTTTHWKVSSQDISYLKIGNSIVDSCRVIIAVHLSSALVVEPLVLKTPPAVCPKPIALYLWESFNQPEHSLCFGRDDNDFNKDDTTQMVVSVPKLDKWDGISHISIKYNLHCAGKDATILDGSSVLSISGLCPLFEACPNRNLFQHFFEIEFPFDIHTYVCAISTFEFARCFTLSNSFSTTFLMKNIVLGWMRWCLRILQHGCSSRSILILFFCATQIARCSCPINLLRQWLYPDFG